MEDRISGGLQYHYEMCCEEGGRCGRQACMGQRWFYRGDVISRQVDLYMIIYAYDMRITTIFSTMSQALYTF